MRRSSLYRQHQYLQSLLPSNVPQWMIPVVVKAFSISPDTRLTDGATHYRR